MTTEAPPARWRKVASAIATQLDELGIDQAELSRQSGVDVKTLRKLQGGETTTYRRSTLTKVARGLQWTNDSIERILRGESPKMALDDARERQRAVLEGEPESYRIDELERRVSELERLIIRVAAERGVEP